MSKIKKIIKRIAYFFLPIRKIILFESAPDLSDNTKAVFDEMIKRGLNKHYKLIWVCYKKVPIKDKIKNVKFLASNKHKVRIKWYYCQALALITCNRFFEKIGKGQHAFYLSHGTPLKSVHDYYVIPNGIDYSFCAGEGIKEIYAYELNVDKDKIITLGYPRNDELTNCSVNVKTYFEGDFDKIVVWYPTFRQHKGGRTLALGNALPIIHDAEQAKRLNEYAKERNVLLVLKPHFAQDLSYLKQTELSNIRFINDDFFVQNKLSSYQFVGSCDALITDYSSIYYDFTLCDKPIALVWEDVEEYKEKPGLVDGYEFYTKGGEKIYTIEDFEGFIDRISKGIDVLKEERNEIKGLSNYADDGQNSKRVVDFIMEKIGA